ncbi:MAG: four helix bundle protein [Kiritimatiellae bacterium]|nr:four helix bundle protein [Kiritimatiellia bacterium]
MGDGALRRNRNRGYQQLIVWQDAIELYVLVSKAFQGFSYELKRIASQEIASADSVHRNIAEGYCRRSIKEYLNFLNIALGSLGETVSGFIACRRADQLTAERKEELDRLAFKLENGLLRLVESLERKRDAGDWTDRLVVKESNAIYGSAESMNLDPLLQDSITPSLHYSTAW